MSLLRHVLQTMATRIYYGLLLAQKTASKWLP